MHPRRLIDDLIASATMEDFMLSRVQLHCQSMKIVMFFGIVEKHEWFIGFSSM